MRQLAGSTLLIGYGNPGRLDDGLGPAVADRARQLGIPQLSVESFYQLAVEHAELAAGFDHVIFADATIDGPEPYQWRPLTPQTTIGFSTHHVSPETVLGLAHTVFRSAVAGHLLAVRGYDFHEFGEYLSNQATQNLDAAMHQLERSLRSSPANAIDETVHETR